MPLLERATHLRFEHLDTNTLPSPRILKSHLTYNIIPQSANEDGKCKYIYVARNPKDVAVSYFKFETNLERFKGPWEFYVKLFLEGNGKFFYGPLKTKIWNFLNPIYDLTKNSIP